MLPLYIACFKWEKRQNLFLKSAILRTRNSVFFTNTRNDFQPIFLFRLSMVLATIYKQGSHLLTRDAVNGIYVTPSYDRIEQNNKKVS